MSHIDEVGKMRLEFRELRQWIVQLKSVIKYLEADCSGDQGSLEKSWSFGTWALGQGRSTLVK